MLHLDHLSTGPLGVNCSLIWNPEDRTGVLVDPGGHGARIQAQVARHGFQVQAILLTHAHFDHVGAAAELQSHYKVPVYLHPEDAFILAMLRQQLDSFGMDPVEAPRTTPLEDGQELHGLRVIHTPGHSPGGCCFLGEGTRGPMLASGDTLFAGGVGRTDLWGGSWDTLVESIQTRLFTLPASTRVVPGHGPTTTLGDEMATNPYVGQR